MMWHQGGYMRSSEPNSPALTLAPPDAHDQSAIVRQYMRYTAQIQSGKTVSKQILRALQMCVLWPMSVRFTSSDIYTAAPPARPLNRKDPCIYGHAGKRPRRTSTKRR